MESSEMAYQPVRLCSERRMCRLAVLVSAGLLVSAAAADGKLVRGPPEFGRSATEGAKELARAKRSQRNTAEARKSLRGNREQYLLANPFGTTVPALLRAKPGLSAANLHSD